MSIRTGTDFKGCARPPPHFKPIYPPYVPLLGWLNFFTLHL